MEEWVEIENPYGERANLYMQVKPRPSNPANTNLRIRPSEGATVIPYAEAGPYKPRIWMKRFSAEDQAVFFTNIFSGESIWAGSDEARAAVNRMTYILPPPPGEKEALEAWKAARNAPPAAAPRELTAAEREAEGVRREREQEIQDRNQQRREAEAQAAERQRQVDAGHAQAPAVAIPRIAPENLEAEGARLLAMDYNRLQEFFGFPRGPLPAAQARELDKIGKKFITLIYHPDKTAAVLGQADAASLFERLNNHLGKNIGAPARTKLVGQGKCMCGAAMPDSLDYLQQMTKESYSASPKEDINGWILQEYTPTIKIWTKGSDAIVGVRGTKSGEDVATWATVPLSTLNTTELYKRNKKTVEDFWKQHPSLQYYAVGHSLGGAMIDSLIRDGLIKEAVSYNPAIQYKDINGGLPNRRIYFGNDPLYRLMGWWDKKSEKREPTERSWTDFLANFSMPATLASSLASHKLSNFKGGRRTGRKVVFTGGGPPMGSKIFKPGMTELDKMFRLMTAVAEFIQTLTGKTEAEVGEERMRQITQLQMKYIREMNPDPTYQQVYNGIAGLHKHGML
jgi:hypothetical protein